MLRDDSPVLDGTYPKCRVVLIDARPERRTLMRRVLEMAAGEGSVVAEVADASTALSAITDSGADVAVLEMPLPVEDGLAIIDTLRVVHPALRIVVCTFHYDAATRRRAVEAGADEYLVKPLNARDLRKALTKRSLEGSLNVIA